MLCGWSVFGVAGSSVCVSAVYSIKRFVDVVGLASRMQFPVDCVSSGLDFPVIADLPVEVGARHSFVFTPRPCLQDFTIRHQERCPVSLSVPLIELAEASPDNVF